MFRLDKTVFKKQTFREAGNNKNYWLSKSADERLQAALYLQSVVYGFDPLHPPRMDKTIFTKRRLSS